MSLSTAADSATSQFRRFVESLDISGKQFERFVKWFLTHDPEWSTQVAEIWLWDDWPERWGPDCGIDLIFVDKGGETWAVQAKQYAMTTSITKKDVDSFLSESSRAVFQRRLLITTTDLIGRNAKQACEGQEKPVVLHMGWDFENAQVNYPDSYLDLVRIKPKKKPCPRPYQKKAILDVVAGLQTADRGQLIMACGTGKTFVSLWIKERLGAQTALVLVPSLSLLSQTLRDWTTAAKDPFDVLCVCSDETVAKRGADEAVRSLSDIPFPVHSDPKHIAGFLQGNGRKVVFATYQSSPLVAAAQQDAAIREFDLVVADEAHRCAGNPKGAFGTVLDTEMIRANKRLFATATPRTYSTSVKRAAESRGIDVIGMDDPNVFGEPLHTLSFGAAIAHDPPLLTDYRVIIIGVDDAMIAEWIENRELVKTESGEPVDAESLAAQIGLLKAIRDYDIHRAISFHGRVSRAKAFCRDIQDTLHNLDDDHRPAGKLWTGFVSGEMPTDQRRKKLSQLKELYSVDRGLLSNVRCLSEGVDVPTLDGVVFVDPRRSEVDIVQAVGRAIRLSKDKEAGSIILPVFIDTPDPMDVEDAIDTSRFKPIWDVLNALRAHDETLAFELDQFRVGMGRRPGSLIERGAFSKIVIDLPRTLDESFAASLRTILVEQTTAVWEFWYGLLQTYYAEHQNCVIKSGYKTVDGYGLGRWVGTQRGNYAKLTEEQRIKLEELGFIWDAMTWKWEEGFQHLQAYIAEHGDCIVPKRYLAPDGYPLGRWVSVQREGRDPLGKERIQRLDSLGFVWNQLQYQWEEGFSYLQAYVDEYGDAEVNGGYKARDGYPLGTWVRAQRQTRNSLSTERIARLDELGFTWSPFDKKWEKGFKHLKTYLAENNHWKVPSQFKTADGYPLGNWVSTQRTNRKKLSDERRARLDEIGFVWDPLEREWEEGFEHLKTYLAENNHSKVPSQFKTADGYPLGNWVSTQRTNRDNLSDEHRARLDEIGFVWDVLESEWEEGFEHLKTYVAQYDDLLISRGYIADDGYPLGNWISTQRTNRDNLSDEHRARLDEIGFIWNPNEERWKRGYQHLCAYVEEHKTCVVPRFHKTVDGFTLGYWVSQQRARKAENKLSDERVARLEALGFVWKVRA